MGGSWKKTTDVPVQSDKFINFPPEFIDERNIYNLNKEKLPQTLKVKKFGGLSYRIMILLMIMQKIKTCDFGDVLVKITDKTPINRCSYMQHGRNR